MTYHTLNTLLLSGRNKFRHKLAHNTYAWRMPNCDIAIRLHNTDILTFRSDGTVIYRTGGWRTVTTKARLNRFGAPGHRIYQHKFNWFINNEPFYEGYTAGQPSQLA